MRVADKIGSLIDRCYVRPLSRFLSPTMFRYAACGAGNMVLDVVWYYIIYHYIVALRYIDLGVVVMSPHVASLVVVFPITFFTGFLLNRYVAFRATAQRSGKQLVRYALSVVGSILLNYILMKLFVELCHIWPTISKMMTTAIVAIYSFLAARYFSFTNKV